MPINKWAETDAIGRTWVESRRLRSRAPCRRPRSRLRASWEEDSAATGRQSLKLPSSSSARSTSAPTLHRAHKPGREVDHREISRVATMVCAVGERARASARARETTKRAPMIFRHFSRSPFSDWLLPALGRETQRLPARLLCALCCGSGGLTRRLVALLSLSVLCGRPQRLLSALPTPFFSPSLLYRPVRVPLLSPVQALALPRRCLTTMAPRVVFLAALLVVSVLAASVVADNTSTLHADYLASSAEEAVRIAQAQLGTRCCSHYHYHCRTYFSSRRHDDLL